MDLIDDRRQPRETGFPARENRFGLGEWLFRNCYCLYAPAYHLYKRYADRFGLKLIRSAVGQGSVVLDVGANIGALSVLFSDMVGPGGRVHAFEPEALNFQRLRQRTRNRENISIYPLAVSDRSGPLKLYRSGSLNVDHRTYDDGSGREAAEAEAVAIDDLFGSRRVDLVKMDIQGSECRALAGMRETLRNNPHAALYIECWPYGLKKAGASGEELLSLISGLGFQPKRIDPQNRRLTDIRFSRSEWERSESQPSIYFDLWCRRV
jgi:FkbM family methyltransferase